MEASNIRKMAEATQQNSERITRAITSELNSQPTKNLGEGQGAIDGLSSSIQGMKASHKKFRSDIELAAIEATAQLEVTLTPQQMEEAKANLDSAAKAVEDASADSVKQIAEWSKATSDAFNGLQTSVGTIAQFNQFFELELAGADAILS